MRFTKLSIAAGLLALAGAVAAEPLPVLSAEDQAPVPLSLPSAADAPAHSTPALTPSTIDQGAQLAVAKEGKGALSLAGVQPTVAVVPPSPVPLPGALWLFGSALLGFMGFSSRRKV